MSRVSCQAPIPAAAGGGPCVAHTLRRQAGGLVILHPQGRGGVGDEGEHFVAGLGGHLGGKLGVGQKEEKTCGRQGGRGGCLRVQA